MTSSVFAWRQTTPLFMPEEEKGPQSPSAVPDYPNTVCTRPAIDSPSVHCSLPYSSVHVALSSLRETKISGEILRHSELLYPTC